jgi:hypothetical protein
MYSPNVKSETSSNLAPGVRRVARLNEFCLVVFVGNEVPNMALDLTEQEERLS